MPEKIRKVGLLLCILLPASASSAEVSPKDCTLQTEDTVRLACYDKIFMPEFLNDASQSSSFGKEQLPLSHPQRQYKGPTEIEAIVTKISKYSRGRVTYLLDNEQLWAQETARYLTIKATDKVTIRRGKLGGYVLSNQRGASTRVVRVR